MSSLLYLAAFAGIVWFWFDSLRANEIAKALCQKLCRHYEVQFLDDSVSLHKLAVRRAEKSGERQAMWWQLVIHRVYHFDFVDPEDSESRHTGTMMMRGKFPSFVDIPGHYERVILDEN
jgi:hypothetical protein